MPLSGIRPAAAEVTHPQAGQARYSLVAMTDEQKCDRVGLERRLQFMIKPVLFVVLASHSISGQTPTNEVIQPTLAATAPAAPTLIENDAGTFSRPTGTFSRPESTFSRPGPTFSRPEGTFSRPTSTFSRVETTFTPQEGTFSRPGPTFSRPQETFGRPGTTFSRPEGTFTPSEGTFSRPGSTFSGAVPVAVQDGVVATPEIVPIVIGPVITLDLPPGATVRRVEPLKPAVPAK
jgi:hypothetical protein